MEPYSGRIVFAGESCEGAAAHAVTRAGVSHVPEGGRLFVHMSVEGNLLMGGYGNRKGLRSGVLEEVFEMFPILKERSQQLAKTLSGGERQMLAIGRGLTSRPKLLMLDEPSLGLAPKLIDVIYEKLHALRERGLTVLLVEQNTGYALELAERDTCWRTVTSSWRAPGMPWHRTLTSGNAIWVCSQETRKRKT
jgi:branched-chain amino acid transport system ATP-binding protein